MSLQDYEKRKARDQAYNEGWDAAMKNHMATQRALMACIDALQLMAIDITDTVLATDHPDRPARDPLVQLARETLRKVDDINLGRI